MSLMRKFVTFAAVVGVTVLGGGFASADVSGSQTVTYSVDVTRLIVVKTGTVALGSFARTDSTGKWDTIGTSGDPALQWASDTSSTDKITVAATGMTSGVTLAVQATDVVDGETGCAIATEGTLVTGAAGSNYLSLGASQNFVTGISACSPATKPKIEKLTYKITTSNADTTASGSASVTYTIGA